VWLDADVIEGWGGVTSAGGSGSSDCAWTCSSILTCCCWHEGGGGGGGRVRTYGYGYSSKASKRFFKEQNSTEMLLAFIFNNKEFAVCFHHCYLHRV
jgi:hypothetical protein